MGNQVVIEEKRKKRKSPFQEENLSSLHKNYKMDILEMDSFLTYWEKGGKHIGFKFPLFLKNTRLGAYKQMGSARLAKSAYKNGHLDTEIWQYVNPHFNEVFKNERGQFRSQMVNAKWANRFVIDWDDAPVATIDELVNYISDLGLPLPQIIVQTGHISFHLLYRMEMDVAPKKSVFNTEVLLLASLLAGVAPNQSGPAVTHEIKQKIRQAGIDVQYAITNPVFHKIRVPGTTKDKELERFLCKGRFLKSNPISREWLWSRFEGTEEIGIFRKSSLPEEKVVPIQSPTINLSELDVHKINISPVAPKPSDDMLIEEYNQIITHRRESNDYWKEYIPVFIEKISEVLPKRYAKPYAEWLCSNLTFLKRDNMFISQLRLAGELNITQTTISKHIRLLINAGILEVKGEYVKSKIPRKYGLGSVMKSAVQKENQFDVLTEEYASGTTNEQMLSDIRSLVHCGVEPEEVVEFIELKMTAKPRGRQRTSREIIHAVDSWIAKTNRKIPSSPIIDIEKYKKEVFGYANQRRAARSH